MGAAAIVGCGGSGSGNTPGTGGSSSSGGAPAAGASSGGSATSGGSPSGTGGSPSGTGGSAPNGTGGTPGGSGGGTSGGNPGTSGGAGTTTGGTAPTTTGGAPSGGAATSGGMSGGVGGAPQGGNAGAAPDLSVEIYDPDKLPRFDIDLPQESITALNLVANEMDERQNTYVKATLRYGTETVSNIGIRIKGEGSFRKLDKKTAFKIKFDEFVDKQAFRGLRRMTLNNMVEDPSFLAERLAYHVFRGLGLPAPRCNSALLYVNNTFYGVYANVEAEDKTFLRRWFASDDGNLYEEGQADFVTGAETKFNLETNETANDRSDLIALIQAVQTASSATLLTDIGTKLDTAHWLKFTAAEAAVNQWDMYAYTVFYINNFRIYSDPTRAKFVFIPWGMDMSMKPFRDSGRPYIPVLGIARQGDRTGGSISAGTIFQKCLQSSTCKAAYIEQVKAVATAYEGMGLEALTTKYYNQIKASVAMDTRKEYTAERFDMGYQTMLTTIRGRAAAMRADVQ